MQKINRAIISVSDKQDVIELAQLLQNCGIEIISTGGTAKYLQNHGIKITKISDVTGFPEIMDGRVKTLHPKIHGGILARGDQDAEAIQQHDIINIDLIIVNLYPFAKVVNKADCTLAEAVENIDIGGPTMIRAAAKNFNYKTVLVDPKDYELIITDIATTGTIPLETRFKLAAKAFAYTASYEDKIANYFGRLDNPDAKPVKFPQTVNRQFVKSQDLRYGENPHQQAAFYIDALQPAAMATAKQIQGKQLSFNNLIDADAAWSCVQEFADTACVIVKHANPCGVAIADTLLEAYDKAFNTDPTSAFGGIIAVNRTIEAKLANYIINQQFAEVIVAPDIDSEAQQIFKQKNNVRVLIVPQPDLGLNYEVKPVNGGLLIQHKDQHQLTLDDIKIVTTRKPTEKELTDLLFSWKVAKFVKSNAIVYAKNSQTIGIGAGQMSRVYSAKIANLKAIEHKHDVANSVMASDAFFPFKDSIETAASLGITAVIQPGGSIRDAEVIVAANKANMAMVFTNIRHFRH